MCCASEEDEERPLIFYSDDECTCCSDCPVDYDSDDPWKDLYELGLSPQKSKNGCSTIYVPLVQHCGVVTYQDFCCSGSYWNNEGFYTLSSLDHAATVEEDAGVCSCSKRPFYNFADDPETNEDSYNRMYYAKTCNYTPSAMQPAAYTDAAVFPDSQHLPKEYKKDKRKRDTLYFCGKAIKIPHSSQKYQTCTSTLDRGALDLEVIAKPMVQKKKFAPQDKNRTKRNKLRVAFGRIIDQQKEKPIARRRQTF